MLALVFPGVRPARASIPTGTQVVLIFVAVGVVGAGVGITIYHFAHKAPSLTGCTVASAAGLSLVTESDRKTFALIGDTAGLKAGERVRVTGKRGKQDPAGTTFLVEKVGKNFGTCPAVP
jgi:hypothetical protein